MLKPLPVGIQTFSDLIRGGFLYVDKTPWIYELIRYTKGAYFLARPRLGRGVLIHHNRSQQGISHKTEGGTPTPDLSRVGIFDKGVGISIIFSCPEKYERGWEDE